MRTVREYLLREILSLFSLSLFIITILFMSQRIIQLTEWAINRGVGVTEMAQLMLYLLPNVLNIIIPIVTLFAILLAFGRLSSDNEITALKASGVSLFRLFPAVLLFAAFATLIALFSSLFLTPRAAHAGRGLRYRIVQNQSESMISEGTFTSLLARTTIYVREKQDNGKLKGVMAENELRPKNKPWTSRNIFFAQAGRFVHDPVALTNELWLVNGQFIQEDRNGHESFASFDTLRLAISLDEFETRTAREDAQRQELDFFAMRDALSALEQKASLTKRERESRLAILIQLHERLAFPLGCLALCFWAVPLGIQPPRAGRARPIVVSVLLSGAFYYLMILAKFMALYKGAPPALALWVPDLAVMLSGAFMLRQKDLERPIPLLSRAEETLYYTLDRVKQRLEERRQK
jgi:lipopolysaccharide export system permease protein